MRFLLALVVMFATFDTFSQEVRSDEPCDTWQALYTYYQGELAFEQGIEATLQAAWDATLEPYYLARAIFMLNPTSENYQAMIAAQQAKDAAYDALWTQIQLVVQLEGYLRSIETEMLFAGC